VTQRFSQSAPSLRKVREVNFQEVTVLSLPHVQNQSRMSHKNTPQPSNTLKFHVYFSGLPVAHSQTANPWLKIQGGGMKDEQVTELLYQALETEIGGVQVYTTAIRCAENDDLKEEWEEYLEQTKNHVTIMEDVLTKLDLDINEETPGRKVVRTIGETLVKTMEMALAEGQPGAAQLVACEAVVLAETKDHQNWHLIGEIAKKSKGNMAKVLKEAHDQVEDEEDEHLYHTKGWCRELWIESLGMKAVLPPPEEEKDVKTAIGAARAEQARTKTASK
jgi:rubrerythrin